MLHEPEIILLLDLSFVSDLPLSRVLLSGNFSNCGAPRTPKEIEGLQGDYRGSTDQGLHRD